MTEQNVTIFGKPEEGCEGAKSTVAKIVIKNIPVVVSYVYQFTSVLAFFVCKGNL